MNPANTTNLSIADQVGPVSEEITQALIGLRNANDRLLSIESESEDAEGRDPLADLKARLTTIVGDLYDLLTDLAGVAQ